MIFLLGRGAITRVKKGKIYQEGRTSPSSIFKVGMKKKHCFVFITCDFFFYSKVNHSAGSVYAPICIFRWVLTEEGFKDLKNPGAIFIGLYIYALYVTD